MPLRHRVFAAKYSMGVVAKPMSITSTPLATKPRISAVTRLGPLRRPSRPTATAVSPSASATVPKDRPNASATASSMAAGTMPRMS